MDAPRRADTSWAQSSGVIGSAYSSALPQGGQYFWFPRAGM